MCKKLLLSGLMLAMLILVPLTANAAFTCDGATLAGSFSGTVAGTDQDGPFSSFMFLTMLSNGTFTVTEVFSSNGIPWQQVQDTGVWSPFFTTQGFCILAGNSSGGAAFLIDYKDNANTILFSSPNSGFVHAAGVFMRSGL